MGAGEAANTKLKVWHHSQTLRLLMRWADVQPAPLILITPFVVVLRTEARCECNFCWRPVESEICRSTSRYTYYSKSKLKE